MRHLLESLYYNVVDFKLFSAHLLSEDGEKKFDAAEMVARTTERKGLLADRQWKTNGKFNEMWAVIASSALKIKKDAKKEAIVDAYLAAKRAAEVGEEEKEEEEDNGVDGWTEGEDARRREGEDEDVDDDGNVASPEGEVGNGDVEHRENGFVVLPEYTGEEEEEAMGDIQKKFEDLLGGEGDESARRDALHALIGCISTRAWHEDTLVVLLAVKKRCEGLLLKSEGVGGTKGGEDIKEEFLEIGKALTKLHKKDTISFTRLWHRSTLHYFAYKKARPAVMKMVQEKYERKEGEEEGEYLRRVCSVDEPLCAFFRFFDNDLSTYHESLRSIGDGNIEPLLRNLPMMIVHLAYYGRFKIVASMLTALDQLQHLILHHKEVFCYVCENARTLFTGEFACFQK